MRIETQYQILPAGLPIEATCREAIPDSPTFADGIIDGMPFRKQNYTTLIFFARQCGAIPGSTCEVVLQRVTVIGVSTLMDALNRLNRETIARAVEHDIPTLPSGPDECGFFGWDFAPCAVRALVHIHEA